MKLTLFSPFWGDVGPQMFSKLHASASCKTRVITVQETISLYPGYHTVLQFSCNKLLEAYNTGKALSEALILAATNPQYYDCSLN